MSAVSSISASVSALPPSCFVSYVCSVYLDCGGLLCPTVGLTARGAPLWPLCVSADQGREGELRWGRAGLGRVLDCSDDDVDDVDDDDESAMASLAFCKLRCCGCLRNLWERLGCFAKKPH